MKLPSIGGKKSKRVFTCQQDPNTREVICRSFREFEDNTRQELAGMNFQFDGMCNAVPTNVFEHEDGELEKLDKRTRPLLRAKCRTIENLPTDY